MTKEQGQAQERAVARECDRLYDMAPKMRFEAGGDCPAAHRLETEASLLWRAWRVQRLSVRREGPLSQERVLTCLKSS